MNRIAALGLVLTAVACVAPAGANDEPAPARPASFAERLLADIRAQVDAVILARPPKLVPPKPIAIKWKLGKLGSVDLGAPLVTLAGADLDGDGKGELYLVTAREVVAIGFSDKKLRELGRVAFTGDRAVAAPRDVVGTAVADGATLIATVSTWTRGLRVSWKKAVLVAEAGDAGFVLCPGEVAQLAPGRNYFGDTATAHYAVRCTSRLVDNDGYPLRARAQLSLANKLDVAIERCAASNLGCQPAARHEYSGVGIAFEIADVDRDGKPEALYAGAGAPGDPDVLKVLSLGDDDKKPKLKKAFTAGGVAGLAATDVDGDGVADAIVAVRLVGASTVDLWRVE